MMRSMRNDGNELVLVARRADELAQRHTLTRIGRIMARRRNRLADMRRRGFAWPIVRSMKVNVMVAELAWEYRQAMRAALVVLALLAAAAPARAAADARLLAAMRQVESGGDDNAVGDGGKARGPLQCWRAAWADACQWGGVTWDYDALVTSWPHCQQVARWYWARYGATTDEQKARLWNGGPGWRRRPAATDGYWRRVKAAMN